MGLKLVWVTKETVDKENELKKLVASAIGQVTEAKKSLADELQKMIHHAYAGIVCDSCGKNSFERVSVHSGAKAYCLDPCWKNLQEALNAPKVKK